MRVSQHKPAPFQPITITLQTQAEADLMKILLRFQMSEQGVALADKIGLEVPSLHYNMWDKYAEQYEGDAA